MWGFDVFCVWEGKGGGFRVLLFVVVVGVDVLRKLVSENDARPYLFLLSSFLLVIYVRYRTSACFPFKKKKTSCSGVSIHGQKLPKITSIG